MSASMTFLVAWVTIDDRAALVGQAAHQVHEGCLGAGVQPGGRLVQEEQAGLGEQLDADGDALDLPAAQLADLVVLAVRQVQVIQHFHDALVALCLGGIGRHAQAGGVIQRLVDRQLHVDDIALGDIADIIADGVEVFVDVDAVDKHLPWVAGR